MLYRSKVGITVSIERNASDLQIYRACRAVGLLENQTHSALTYGEGEDETIVIERARDGRVMLILDRVNVCGKV